MQRHSVSLITRYHIYDNIHYNLKSISQIYMKMLTGWIRTMRKCWFCICLLNQSIICNLPQSLKSWMYSCSHKIISSRKFVPQIIIWPWEPKAIVQRDLAKFRYGSVQLPWKGIDKLVPKLPRSCLKNLSYLIHIFSLHYFSCPQSWIIATMCRFISWGSSAGLYPCHWFTHKEQEKLWREEIF